MAVMRWLRRSETNRLETHRVVVVEDESVAGPEFVAWCDCGWTSSSQRRKSDAFREADRHGYVQPEVEFRYGGGFDDWQCLFCGAVIEEGPVCIRLAWTEDGGEQDEWWGAHRECLTQRASEYFRSGSRLVGA